jgi:hypothetical protein
MQKNNTQSNNTQEEQRTKQQHAKYAVHCVRKVTIARKELQQHEKINNSAKKRYNS